MALDLDQGERLHVGLRDGLRDRLVVRRGDLLDGGEPLALRGLVVRRLDGVEVDDLRLAHLAAGHGLVDGRHLLAERACELELADDAEPDQCLAEPLAGLALARQSPLELLFGDEPARDEDLADPAPVLAERRLEPRPGVAAVVLPLLGHDLRELCPGDAEALDEDLAELLVGLLLDLEREPDLALGDETALDEERADETGPEELLRVHASCIGNPPFGLQGQLASPAAPSPACTTPCSYA